MTDRFYNAYRIPSTRLPQWNYSSTGYYFITICTRNMEHYFGEIVDGKMKLSEIGQIAKKYWLEIPNHFPHTKLDEYIIMPNHMHGIIVINVETQNFASLQQRINKFGPQSRNLASIIRGFKVGVKKWATINNNSFQWQSRFYDHVIRNEQSLNNIREYINNNPLNWDEDIENTLNNNKNSSDYYKNIISAVNTS